MSDKTKVVITDEQKSVKVPKGVRMIVRRSCLASLQAEGIAGPCVINVTFTDNAKMRELKKRNTGEEIEAGAMWLPETGGGEFGTIVISMEKAQQLARFYDCSFQKEICYLTVHETLRLIEHKKQSRLGKAQMQEKEETIMYRLGLPLSSGYELNNNLQELSR